MGMDLEPLYRLPPLSPGERGNRRIQRKIHVQPDRVAGWGSSYPGGACKGDLSQFFPTLGALGICRTAARGGHWMKNGTHFAFHALARGEESFRDTLLFMISRPGKKAFGTRCWRAWIAPRSGCGANSFTMPAARICSRRYAASSNTIRPEPRSRSWKKIRSTSRLRWGRIAG